MTLTIAEASVKIGADLKDLRAEIMGGAEAATAGVSASVKIDADTAEADAKIAATDAELDHVNGRTVTAKVKVSSGAGQDAEKGISSLLTGVVALGPALVPVTAAVIGFGGAAAASLGAAALGAGTVALAFGAIKKEVAGDLTPALNQLKSTASAGILPGVKADIALLIPALPKVNQLIAGTSTEIGKLSREAGAGLGGSAFSSFFAYVDRSAVPILNELGHTVGNVAEGVAKLAVGFAPVTAEVGAGLESLSSKFAASAGSTAGFHDFVSYVVQEGPQVAHTLEDVAGAGEHLASALAPIGTVSLDVIDGFAKITSVVPTPALTALLAAVAGGAVAFKAFSAAEKIAAISTKAFAADATGLEAAMGPVGLALAAATVVFTAYEGAKLRDAANNAQQVAGADEYVAALHTVYTSQGSVADSTQKITDRMTQLKGIQAYITVATNEMFKGQAQTAIGEYNAKLGQLTVQSRQAVTNSQLLGAQYGLTTAQVNRLAGGSQHLVGTTGSVSARFRSLYEAAQATHHPLTQAAGDEATLGDKAATAAQQLTALSDEMAIFAGNALSTDAAALQFKDDISTLEGALKKSKGSFDSNTTAGRASAEALNNAAQAAIATANATEKSTGSVAKARSILEAQISTLRKVTGSTGDSTGQIKLLQQALDHLPQSSAAAAKAVNQNADAIKAGATNSASAATTALTKATPNAKVAGQQFGAGYAQGIVSSTPAVQAAAAGLANSAAGSVRSTQKSKSPSLVMDAEGRNAGNGYAQGVVASTPAAAKAAGDLASKSVAAAAKATKDAASKAKATASTAGSLSDYIGLGFNSDITGTTPKQINTGVRDLRDRLAGADRQGTLTSARRKKLDDALDLTRARLDQLSVTSKKVSDQYTQATSALSALKSAAASVRSTSLSNFQGLGDPGQFNGITSLAGVNSVLGKQDALGAAFEANLAKARKDGLNKAAYAALDAGGPAQDSQIAALLATGTKEQIREFDRREAQLTKEGNQTGSASANYLFGADIKRQTKVVERLHDDLETLKHEQHRTADLLERYLDREIKHGDASTKTLVAAVHQIGPSVARSLSDVTSSAKQSHRARVAGARG